MTAAADVMAAVRRADQRWCKDTADEPLDTARVEHLAAAVQLVDQAGPAPDAGDDTSELERERDRYRGEVHRVRTFLTGALALSANQVLSMSTMDLCTMLANQPAGETEQLRTELAEVRADSQRRVDHAVQACTATITVLQDKIRDLRIDVAAAKRELVATEPADLIAAAVADVRAEASLQRDADQRILHDAHEARDHYRTALARVVAAAVGDWHDTDDPIRQADTAVDLIHRVIEAFTAHRHAYEYRGPTKPPGPCLVAGCGKPYPSGKGRVA